MGQAISFTSVILVLGFLILITSDHQGMDNFGCLIGVAFATALLADLLQWARRGNQDFGMRLIKGAFWDEEVVLASLYNYPVPVFTRKHETDASFERCARTVLENHRHIQLKCGSHNIRSAAYVIECARQLQVPEDRLEFQMLHGMAENLREAWKQHNLRLRLYSPVGEIIPGMAYLVRRLLENTSSESFLRQSFADGAAREEMLRDPATVAENKTVSEKETKTAAIYGEKGPFSNEPPVEWDVATHAAFSAALENIKTSFPRPVLPIVDGSPTGGGKKMLSTDPNKPERVVAEVTCADADVVETKLCPACKRIERASALFGEEPDFGAANTDQDGSIIGTYISE